MVTIGIDLAAQPANTAACRVSWNERVAVDDPMVGIEDQAIADALTSADRVGIDVPLGWPVGFSQGLAQHAAGRGWPAQPVGKELTYRLTDRFVHEHTGRWPLSVSADKIAVPAIRAARILGQFQHPPDRAGGGVLIEVYPAAALHVWRFDSRGYKGQAGRRLRESLVRRVVAETEAWVTIAASAREAFLDDDNCFDAFVAALVARAWATGNCWPPPRESLGIVAGEGWIALPRPGTLSTLAGGGLAHDATMRG